MANTSSITSSSSSGLYDLYKTSLQQKPNNADVQAVNKAAADQAAARSNQADRAAQDKLLAEQSSVANSATSSTDSRIGTRIDLLV